jgi:hypothetical protein
MNNFNFFNRQLLKCFFNVNKRLILIFALMIIIFIYYFITLDF